MIKLIIGVLIVGFIAISSFMLIDPNIQKTSNSASVTETTNENTFSATIEGEVFKSGTYVVTSGATIGDLIQAAGGTTDNADPLCYFTTASISKGNNYYIAPKYDTGSICSTSELEKVNINEADKETLMTVSGFTSSISSSIISYRETTGQFQTLEDLLNVYGIGNATYRKVRNYVILHS